MPGEKKSITRYKQLSGQGTQQMDDNQATIAQVSSVRDYVREHTMHSWAANDSHRFALADFLIQHQRQRANAELESEKGES